MLRVVGAQSSGRAAWFVATDAERGRIGNSGASEDMRHGPAARSDGTVIFRRTS